MASTRLAVWMKDHIQARLVEHGFSSQVMDLIADQAVFARRVFDDLVPPGVQVRLGELPKGWVPEVDEVKVQFGSGSGVVGVALNGRIGIYGDLSEALATGDSQSVETVRRRLPYSLKGGVAKVYDVGDPLQRENEDLCQRRGELTQKIVDAGKVIRATLDSFTTVNALIGGWPEVEPFAAKYLDKPPTQLPVVPRAHLNNLLDLPVEEGAPS